MKMMIILLPTLMSMKIGHLDDYRSVGRKYENAFDGDDQLSELNEGITELAEENRQLRRRIKLLKETQSKTTE